LGYDPIFKQQPQPAALQPAPPASQPVVNSNPYGAQPQLLQSGYGLPVSTMGYEQALSAGVSSPGSSTQQFDYASAIDPALEAAAPPPAANPYQQAAMPTFRDDLKRELQSASPLSAGGLDTTPHLRGGASSFPPSSLAAAYPTPAKKYKMEELLALGGPVPAPLENANVADNVPVLDEIKNLYHSVYSPGLENLLESKWYPVKGIATLLKDKQLLDLYAVLLDRFAKTSSADPKAMAESSAVEARLIWGLATMVRTAAAAETNGSSTTEPKTIPPSDDVVEAGHRLNVFESLLTGHTAESNPLVQPAPGTTDHHKTREFQFWHELGNFVTLKDDQPENLKAIDDSLSALRNLLDGRENRDILYSICIVRAIGNRIADYNDQDPMPHHLDEADWKNKLNVAKRFIRDEGNGAGTTNVVRRFCEMAYRSWTTPGIGE
jgi:hypothetical protein